LFRRDLWRQVAYVKLPFTLALFLLFSFDLQRLLLQRLQLLLLLLLQLGLGLVRQLLKWVLHFVRLLSVPLKDDFGLTQEKSCVFFSSAQD
jgi:hypothetical protein